MAKVTRVRPGCGFFGNVREKGCLLQVKSSRLCKTLPTLILMVARVKIRLVDVNLWILSARIHFRRKSLPSLPVHIVTAADHTHELSLLNLLKSVEKFEPSARLTVWNLGLTDQVLSQISKMSRVRLMHFDFSLYPSYFEISNEAGQYAWKPVLINRTVSTKKELLLWLDAGCLLQGRLKWLRRIAEGLEFFSPFSSGTIKDWTHPGTLSYLNFQGHPNKHRNLNAAIVAFRTDSIKAMSLLKDWSTCAQNRDCIAPAGSSRLNHRQDQAVLTVLGVMMGFQGGEFFRNLHRPLNVVTHRDVD